MKPPSLIALRIGAATEDAIATRGRCENVEIWAKGRDVEKTRGQRFGFLGRAIVGRC